MTAPVGFGLAREVEQGVGAGVPGTEGHVFTLASIVLWRSKPDRREAAIAAEDVGATGMVVPEDRLPVAAAIGDGPPMIEQAPFRPPIPIPPL